MLHAQAIPTLLLFGLGQVADAAPPRRYVSSQAYYHTLRAEVAQAQGDLTTAADELSLALVYDNKSSLLTERLARVSVELKRFKKARSLVDQAKRWGRPSAGLLVLDAELAERAKQWKKAERAYKRAVRSDPSDIKLALRLGSFLAARGRSKEAIKILTMASEAAPQAPEALGLIASLEAAAHRYEAAAVALERAVLRAPDALSYRLRLDAIYERLERGLEGADRLLAFSGAHPASVEGSLAAAEALARVGRTEEAQALFERVLASSPKACELVGYAWLRQADFQRAVHVLRGCGPSDNPMALKLALGRAHLALGQSARGLKLLNGIVATAPEFVAAQVLMARDLAARGRARRAAALISRAARLSEASELHALSLRFEWISQATLPSELPAVAAADLADLIEWLARQPSSDRQKVAVDRLRASLPRGLKARIDARLRAVEGDKKGALGFVKSRWRDDAGPEDLARWAAWRLAVKGRTDWAKDAFRRAPRHPRSLLVYGAALIAEGEIEHALDVLDRGVRHYPHDSELRALRAEVHLSRSDTAAARADLKGALKLMVAPFGRHSPAARESRQNRIRALP